MHAIPTIDLTKLLDRSAPDAVAAEIRRACRDVGFFYVVNHGIPEPLCERARDAALAFFQRPPADKSRCAISAEHRGYLPHGGSRMYDDALPDLKESFVWGREPEPGEAPGAFLGPNRWPDDGGALQAVSQDFFRRAHGVVHALLRAFALGLDLPERTFLVGFERPISRASYVYYPPQPAQTETRQYGVAPHTDFGVLTILRQDDVGGLEVRTVAGDWVDAAPLAGALVVNVGDLLARWTGGYYRSTPHRVVNRSGRERLSIVCAYDPAYETLIDPNVMADTGLERPVLNETDGVAPIACGDYLRWRFDRAFSHRQRR